MNAIPHALAVLLALAPPAAPPFCVSPPPVVHTEWLVAKAEVVVRAVAERELGPAEVEAAGLDPRERWLEFRAVEVLRGSNVPETFFSPGFLMQTDDFNPGRVPYSSPRGGWSGGSCYPYGHRQGGEFLLLLRKVRGRALFLRVPRGGWTPFWGFTGPTNEQVRGADDPWVRWVREQVERGR